jgi:hypothetical protein
MRQHCESLLGNGWAGHENSLLIDGVGDGFDV